MYIEKGRLCMMKRCVGARASGINFRTLMDTCMLLVFYGGMLFFMLNLLALGFFQEQIVLLLDSGHARAVMHAGIIQPAVPFEVKITSIRGACTTSNISYQTRGPGINALLKEICENGQYNYHPTDNTTTILQYNTTTIQLPPNGQYNYHPTWNIGLSCSQ